MFAPLGPTVFQDFQHVPLRVAAICVDADGSSAEGLAVGNLIVAVAAIAGSMAITLLSHPTEPSE